VTARVRAASALGSECSRKSTSGEPSVLPPTFLRGSETVIASGGVIAGQAVTDGKFVYVLGGGTLYKFGVGESLAAFDAGHKHVDPVPFGDIFRGLVTDGTDLFVHTINNVYRAAK